MKKLVVGLVVAVVIFVVGLMVLRSALRYVPQPAANEEPSLVNNMANRVKSATDDAGQWSTMTLQDSIKDFSSYLPVIKEAGFEVSEIRVEMSLIPSISAIFEQTKVLTEAEQKRILKQHEGKRVLSYVLQSLFKAYGTSLGQFKLEGVEIVISIPPSTTLLISPISADEKPGDGEHATTKPAERKIGH